MSRGPSAGCRFLDAGSRYLSAPRLHIAWAWCWQQRFWRSGRPQQTQPQFCQPSMNGLFHRDSAAVFLSRNLKTPRPLPQVLDEPSVPIRPNRPGSGQIDQIGPQASSRTQPSARASCLHPQQGSRVEQARQGRRVLRREDRERGDRHALLRLEPQACRGQARCVSAAGRLAAVADGRSKCRDAPDRWKAGCHQAGGARLLVDNKIERSFNEAIPQHVLHPNPNPGQRPASTV